MADAHPEGNNTGGKPIPGTEPSAPIRKPRRRVGLRILVSVIGLLLLVFASFLLFQFAGARLPDGLPFMPLAPTPTNTLRPATPTSTPLPSPRRPPIDLQNAESTWFGGSLGKGRLMQVAFAPDGDRFIAMTMMGFYLYNVQDLTDPSFEFVFTRVEEPYLYPKPEVLSYAVSPADGRIAVGYSLETVKIWNPEKAFAGPLTILADDEDKLLMENYSDSTCLAFSPDGALVAAGGSNSVVRLYHIPSGELLGELAVVVGGSYYDTKKITSVSFSPDGLFLASASADGVIYLWRVLDGSLAAVLQGHKSMVNALAFSPDGSTLASGSWDGTVRLWRVADGSESKILLLESGVSSVVFSPDGSTLAAGAFDGTARFWRMPDGEPARIIAGHSDAVVSVAFSPDGATLATASLDGSVKFWGAADCLGIAALDGFLTDVASLDFSPDDSIIAAGLGNGDIQLLRLVFGSDTEGQFGSPKSGTMWSEAGDVEKSSATDFYWPLKISSAGVLHGHTSRANSIAFSPDGEFLASGSLDATVRVWRVADGLPVADLREHKQTVKEIAYSPDGTLLASAGEDGFIHLWNTKDWSQAGSLELDGEPFTQVAFSPDGKMLATGSRSLEEVNSWGNVAIWNLSDKSVIRKFRASETWDVFDLAFSPDSGKLVVSTSNTLTMYDVQSGWGLWSVKSDEARAQPVGVGFLPGGDIVFCADDYIGNLCMFNAATGKRIPALYTQYKETCKVASHKGNILAAGTTYGFIDLFYVS